MSQRSIEAAPAAPTAAPVPCKPAAHPQFSPAEARVSLWTLQFASAALETNFKGFISLRAHTRQRWASLALLVIVAAFAATEHAYGLYYVEGSSGLRLGAEVAGLRVASGLLCLLTVFIGPPNLELPTHSLELQMYLCYLAQSVLISGVDVLALLRAPAAPPAVASEICAPLSWWSGGLHSIHVCMALISGFRFPSLVACCVTELAVAVLPLAALASPASLAAWDARPCVLLVEVVVAAVIVAHRREITERIEYAALLHVSAQRAMREALLAQMLPPTIRALMQATSSGGGGGRRGSLGVGADGDISGGYLRGLASMMGGTRPVSAEASTATSLTVGAPSLQHRPAGVAPAADEVGRGGPAGAAIGCAASSAPPGGGVAPATRTIASGRLLPWFVRAPDRSPRRASAPAAGRRSSNVVVPWPPPPELAAATAVDHAREASRDVCGPLEDEEEVRDCIRPAARATSAAAGRDSSDGADFLRGAPDAAARGDDSDVDSSDPSRDPPIGQQPRTGGRSTS